MVPGKQLGTCKNYTHSLVKGGEIFLRSTAVLLRITAPFTGWPLLKSKYGPIFIFLSSKGEEKQPNIQVLEWSPADNITHAYLSFPIERRWKKKAQCTTSGLGIYLKQGKEDTYFCLFISCQTAAWLLETCSNLLVSWEQNYISKKEFQRSSNCWEITMGGVQESCAYLTSEVKGSIYIVFYCRFISM